MTGRARRARRVGAVAIAALGVLTSCTDGGSTDGAGGAGRTTTDAPSTPTPPAYVPRFVDGECPVTIPSALTATCGTVELPEDRAHPDGRQVSLAVVRIHSTSDDPRPDPVVHLHGGPGSGRIPAGFTSVVGNPILAERDIVYYDQRGTGFSEPSLECPERELAFVGSLGRIAPFAEELSNFDSALAACHDRLEQSGIDLSRYGTPDNSADLADLRVALGVDEWNLWGISYGTRLALETMRSHPTGIRSVVLDSVYPTDAGSADASVRSGEAAFQALADGCAADPVCTAAVPDLRVELDRAAQELDEWPFTYDHIDAEGTPIRLVLTGDDAVAGLFNALYETTLIPLLPSAITGLAHGQRAIVPMIAQIGIPFINDMAEGAFLSAECIDNGARLDRAEVERLRAEPGRASVLLLASWQLFCDRWPVEQLPASFADPVRSDIPTLVVAGEYDPITPAAGSRRVAEALERSVFVQVPRGGHGPALDTDCTRGVFGSFFDDLDGVDVSCVADLEPLPFVG